MPDHQHDPHADHHDTVHHVGHIGTYVMVFLALCVGTIVTYLAAKVDMGALNAPVALIIATGKALLVILFFMHVKDSNRLTKMVVACGFFWLCILLSLTMTDFLSRVWH